MIDLWRQATFAYCKRLNKEWFALYQELLGCGFQPLVTQTYYYKRLELAERVAKLKLTIAETLLGHRSIFP